MLRKPGSAIFTGNCIGNVIGSFLWSPYFIGNFIWNFIGSFLWSMKSIWMPLAGLVYFLWNFIGKLHHQAFVLCWYDSRPFNNNIQLTVLIVVIMCRHFPRHVMAIIIPFINFVDESFKLRLTDNVGENQRGEPTCRPNLCCILGSLKVLLGQQVGAPLWFSPTLPPKIPLLGWWAILVLHSPTFYRQGFVTDKQSMYTLVAKYLPLEYRQEVIPMAGQIKKKRWWPAVLTSGLNETGKMNGNLNKRRDTVCMASHE